MADNERTCQTCLHRFRRRSPVTSSVPQMCPAVPCTFLFRRRGQPRSPTPCRPHKRPTSHAVHLPAHHHPNVAQLAFDNTAPLHMRINIAPPSRRIPSTCRSRIRPCRCGRRAIRLERVSIIHHHQLSACHVVSCHLHQRDFKTSVISTSLVSDPLLRYMFFEIHRTANIHHIDFKSIPLIIIRRY